MPRLCNAAILDSYAHVVDEVLRCLIVCTEEYERDHYMFLHAALKEISYKVGVRSFVSGVRKTAQNMLGHEVGVRETAQNMFGHEVGVRKKYALT